MTQPLRDYQVDLIAQIEAAIAQGHRRIMLQLPTGAGKTRCFVELVKNHRFAPYADGVYNCLIIAHRTELIDQAKKYLKQELRDTSYIHIGIIKAGRELSPRCSIQVASIQTLNSKLDRKQWVPPAGLVIIDEAHHATAKSYQKAIEHYSNAIILGVTATPIRTDGKGFKDSFDILIKGPSINELTAQQHLCPFRLFAYYIQRINLRNVSTRAGDFDLNQLADAVVTSEVRADLVKTWEQYAKGKRTVVFAVNIQLSKEYAEAYCNAGYVAEHVDGETPDGERDKILERFTKGETQILCNCSIVTEGFDLPEMECVQIVRPTKSLSLWLQMVGRSLRYAEGKTAIILDHTDNYERLGLPDAERNWTLDGIDRNSQKSVKSKKSTREKERKLDQMEGELSEVYSNLIDLQTTPEISINYVQEIQDVQELEDRIEVLYAALRSAQEAGEDQIKVLIQIRDAKDAAKTAQGVLEYKKSINTGAEITCFSANCFAMKNNYEREFVKFAGKNFSGCHGILIGETEDTVLGKLFISGDILFCSAGEETYKRVGIIENGEARTDNQDVNDLILGKFDKYLHSNLERMIKKKAKLQEEKAKKQKEENRCLNSLVPSRLSRNPII